MKSLRPIGILVFLLFCFLQTQAVEAQDDHVCVRVRYSVHCLGLTEAEATACVNQQHQDILDVLNWFGITVESDEFSITCVPFTSVGGYSCHGWGEMVICGPRILIEWISDFGLVNWTRLFL